MSVINFLFKMNKVTVRLLNIYSYETSIIVRRHIMKQNTDFQEGISQAESTATPLPTPKLLTTNDSF